MSISKLTNSAFNFGLEVSPALANLNFDFSLFKLNVEPEYKAIGEALSCTRRREAEQGRPQVTARKLAELFTVSLPRVPTLIQSYGKRASEIIGHSKISDDQRARYGAFAEQAGPDATSLWAASTSGRHAVAVHLLACMLARMWDASFAVSIWVEIVEERRREVEKEFEDTNFTHGETLVAARRDISREQLAEWDASTRAWLRIADKAKSEEVQNLSLVVDAVRLPVNEEQRTYASVMRAWKTSLVKMEALLSGTSQAVQSGELLLAAYAWHLFPCISSGSNASSTLAIRDGMFPPSATVTIGLEESPMTKVPGDGERHSVYWSLPLARVRQYGAPIRSLGTLDSTERDRLTVKELLQAILGCYLREWREMGLRTISAVGLLSDIEVLLAKAAALPDCPEGAALIENPGSWLALLFEAANDYRTSVGNQRLRADSLISLGRRYGDNFLGTPSVSITDIIRKGRYVTLIEKEDEQIRLLRKVAQEISELLGCTDLIIRYKRRYWSTDIYEYASALPSRNDIIDTSASEEKDKKRKLHQFLDASGHRRWLCAGAGLTDEFQKIDQAFYQYQYGKGSSALDSIDDFFGVDTVVFTEAEQRRQVSETYKRRKATYEALGEIILRREDLTLSELGELFDGEGNHSRPENLSRYIFLYGDEQSCGLFIRGKAPSSLTKDWLSRCDIRYFSSLTESGSILPVAFARKMYGTLRTVFVEGGDTNRLSLTALKAMSTMMKLYKTIPRATVDVRSLRKYIVDASWFRSCEKRQKDTFHNHTNKFSQLFQQSTTSYEGLKLEEFESEAPDRIPMPDSFNIRDLNTTEAFSCIALFDSGGYDIHPSGLENAIAMSSTDSMYVSGSLLSDPWDKNQGQRIVHMEGNIGRPGISFLVPPPTPMIKEVKITEWPQTTDQVFDGNIQDQFSSTSLHLRFTGDSSKVDVGSSYVQESMVYKLETLISLHDNKEWIADLDINKSLQSSTFRRVSLCSNEHHKEGREPLHFLSCVDNWNELVQPAGNEGISLVRAHKNWEARLAASALGVALGYTTLLLPDKLCWQCFEEELGPKPDNETIVVVA